MKPASIWDDGVHTHIELTEKSRHYGHPVLEIRSDQGKPTPHTDRWDGDTLIVDALFKEACLLEGVGRKQQRACIHNEGYKADAGN
jgi:type IV secretory pathway VirB9-like protein